MSLDLPAICYVRTIPMVGAEMGGPCCVQAMLTGTSGHLHHDHDEGARKSLYACRSSG
jgi:hypothetical protein